MNLLKAGFHRNVLSRYGTQLGIEINAFRTLYTRDELGIVLFERSREDTRNQFKDDEEVNTFKRDITTKFPSLRLDVKRNELKKYLMLIEGDSNELTTLQNLLRLYHHEYNHTVHKVRPFCFGTPIMRLFYYMNAPKLALQFFNDFELNGVFDQQQTYKVLLDLLYKHGQYTEVYEEYEIIRTHQETYNLRPDKVLDCLVFAACYQLNTSEHFEYALKLWDRVKEYNNLKRCRSFVAALALKQNNPKKALEIIGDDIHHVLPRFICVIGHTQIGNFDEAFQILMDNIVKSKNARHEPTFSRQIIDDLKKAVQQSGSAEHLRKFQRIEAQLNENHLITDETLDQHLCKEFPSMLPKQVFKKLQRNKLAK